MTAEEARRGPTGRPVTANARAFRVLVRNAMFRRVELAALRQYEELGELDAESGWDAAPELLQAAAGSAMLPDEQAHNLIDVFTVLQRLRLRYQLIEYQRGEKPVDVVSRDKMSPIDRSVRSRRPSGRSPLCSGAWTTSPPKQYGTLKSSNRT